MSRISLIALFVSVSASFSAPIAFAQDRPSREVHEYVASAEKLKDGLVKALAGGGTDEMAEVVRSFTAQAQKVGLFELNDFVLEQNGERALEIAVNYSSSKVVEANRRLRRAGLTAIIFVQNEEAELVERFRALSKNDSPEHVQGELETLKRLSTIVPHYQNPSEKLISIGVLKDEIEKTNKVLAAIEKKHASKFDYRFVNDPSVQSLDQIVLPRSNQPAPGDEARYKKLMFWRMMTPATVLAAGLLTGTVGYLSTHDVVTFAQGALVGGVSAGLEWQFAHFSAWWNDKVWTKYGIWAGITANIGYPLITQLVTVAVLAGFGRTEELSTWGYWGEFGFETLWKGSIFIGTVYAAQLAIAEMKARGIIDETQRFARETSISFIGNVGRVLGTVSQLANLKIGSVIGHVINGGIATFYTVPYWFRLRKGSAIYDGYTNYLASVQAGEDYLGKHKGFYNGLTQYLDAEQAGEKYTGKNKLLYKFCGKFLSK